MEQDKPTITRSLIVSGTVKDVCSQLKQMSNQFPNMTIAEMLKQYGREDMILN